MTGLLSQMTQSSLSRLAQARTRESETALWQRASDIEPAPPLRLSPEGFDVIAECKLHSPSSGDLSAQTPDKDQRIIDYACAGACAVSVLTEPLRFGGTLEHLERAARVLRSHQVPVMRKDFLVDPYQVMEARAAGAGGVLVIVRMLDRSRISALLDCAAMLKMFVLLEAFDAADLQIADEILQPRRDHAEQILVGLNCRDLDTLSVELERFGELAQSMPEGFVPVAESGVNDLDDVRTVVGHGYQVALVGTALMRSSEPRRLLGDMLATGRSLRIAQGDAQPA